MKSKKARIPDILLERLSLGELDKKEEETIMKRLEEAGEMSRLEEIKLSSKEILRKYPSEKIVSNIKERYRVESIKEEIDKNKRKKMFLKQVFIIAPAITAALVAILILGPGIKVQVDNGIENTDGGVIIDGNRVKDGPKLFIFRKKTTGEEKMRHNSIVSAGDTLQLAYASGEYKYGIIFSVDGSGYITLHYPYNKSNSLKLDSGEKTFLNDAWELDDAPDFERFFFIVSDGEMVTDNILKKASVLKSNPGMSINKLESIFRNRKIIELKVRKGQ